MMKSKKFIVLAMACVMMFGATLTVQAANCDWVSTGQTINHCGSNYRTIYRCVAPGHNHYKCGTCNVEI